MPRIITALVALTTLAACEPPSPENATTATYEVLPELPLEMSAEIGGAAATGPAALGIVRDVTLLHDADRLAVADWDSQEIRVFDLEGQYLETLGRRGEGPGEFKGLGQVTSLPGGAVVAWDGSARRVTMFLDDGVATIEPDLSVFPGRDPVFLGLWPDTTVVLRLDVSMRLLKGRPAGRIVDTVRVARFDRQGQVIGEPDTVVAPPQTYYDKGQVWGTDRDILGAMLQSTMGGDLWAVGTGERAAVRMRRYDGEVSRVAVPLPTPTSTEDQIDAERDQRMANVRMPVIAGVDLESQMRDVIADLPSASTIPAFDQLRSGPTGALWVRRYLMPGDSIAHWLLRDPDGAWRGHVSLPADERFMSGTSTHLVTLGRDELSAAVVRVYSVGEE